MEKNYVAFTEEMKKDYTILVPPMLPMHFKMIISVLRTYGYTLELLEDTGPHIADMGLKYVHNDTCYPAILMIGEFMNAILSGKYDPHKVAIIMFQTGGGCRASNYISLLRKALKKAGYGYVPVISFSLAGIEDHPGFKLTLPKLHGMLYAVVYGDLLLSLSNQCRPYEINKGQTKALADSWTKKLGRELGIFTTVDVIGQGLPVMLPNGARIIQLLQRFVEDEEQRRGWLLTKTPLMAKSDLYKISGHWDHYLDGMFVMGDPAKSDTEEVYALRPMTCPFQYQAYLNKARSYRDLPLRYNETSTLFRNEDSGEMHGLIRVRQFTISEGHLMCTPDQLEGEFRHCLELAIYMLKTLGLYEDVSYRFSQWDPADRKKYIGTPEQWDEAQGIMKKILDHLEIPYKVGVGEAAFYGPKLDIQIKNVHGKEDTLITIQIDQMLSKNFDMEYVDRDGTKKNPYIIHRTSLGCYERTLALLIEKYAGAFPTWLAPVQVKVLPISEKYADYAARINRTLIDRGIRSELDDRAEKIGYKIREAQLEKIPYMIVVGEKEQEENTVSLRSRKEGDLGSMPLSAFIAKVEDQVRTKELNI